MFFPLNSITPPWFYYFIPWSWLFSPYSLWFYSTWIPRLSPARRWECSKAEQIIPKFQNLYQNSQRKCFFSVNEYKTDRAQVWSLNLESNIVIFWIKFCNQYIFLDEPKIATKDIEYLSTQDLELNLKFPIVITSPQKLQTTKYRFLVSSIFNMQWSYSCRATEFHRRM